MTGAERDTNVIWDGVEKRRTGPLTLRELEDHIDRHIRVRLSEHSEDEARRLDAKFDELKVLIISAFPGADPIGHRQYHEAEIRRVEERADFWRKLRLELAKWGLMGLIGWLIVAAWQHFLHGPKG